MLNENIIVDSGVVDYFVEGIYDLPKEQMTAEYMEIVKTVKQKLNSSKRVITGNVYMVVSDVVFDRKESYVAARLINLVHGHKGYIIGINGVAVFIPRSFEVLDLQEFDEKLYSVYFKAFQELRNKEEKVSLYSSFLNLMDRMGLGSLKPSFN